MLKFDISVIIEEFDLDPAEKQNLVRLFEFCQYLFDNDENLTKTMNLVKQGREQLVARMKELFEYQLENQFSKQPDD